MPAVKVQNSGKQKFPMLRAILGWPVLGILIGLLIGSGFAVLSMAPPRLRIAQTCYSIAALIFWAKFAYWAVTSDVGFRERIFVSLGVFGMSGALLIWGLCWVQDMVPTPVSANPPAARPEPLKPEPLKPEPPPPPLIRQGAFSTLIPFVVEDDEAEIPYDSNTSDPLLLTYTQLAGIARVRLGPQINPTTRQV